MNVARISLIIAVVALLRFVEIEDIAMTTISFGLVVANIIHIAKLQGSYER